MSETATDAGTPAQVQLTVSQIQLDLKNGLTRDNIQAKYELTKKDLKELFSHDKLKGLKTHVKPKFVLVDDTIPEAEGIAVTESPVIEEAPQKNEATEEWAEEEVKTTEEF